MTPIEAMTLEANKLLNFATAQHALGILPTDSYKDICRVYSDWALLQKADVFLEFQKICGDCGCTLPPTL